MRPVRGSRDCVSHGSGARRLLAVVLLALLVGACAGQAAGTPGSSPAPGSDAGRVSVVATTTVLADFVSRVGGDRVDVMALVPKGGEVHTFDPSPSDVVRLSRADVLLMNGLGLDDWVEPLASDAGRAGLPIVALAENLDGVPYIEGGAEEHAVNPHLWLNVSLARRYVEEIRAELAGRDPANASDYATNAAAYDAELADLDAWIRAQLSAVPREDRRVVSFHDAFPYFAAAYDLEIVGVVVESPGQEPSASEVAALVGAIREARVGAILAEAQFSDRLAKTIAGETGATVVSELYTDSVGDAPLDSYLAVMRWNTEQIVEALR